MQETGSMVNLLCGFTARNTVDPVVGGGCTEYCWSDRHAYTVVEVVTPKKVVVQQDKAKRTDKNYMSECQDYVFTPDPEAPKKVLTLRLDGKWREQGCSKGNGNVFRFGHRNKYYDYTF